MKRRKGYKFAAYALSAAMAFSAMPSTAFAVTGDQVAKDGIYTAKGETPPESESGPVLKTWSEIYTPLGATIDVDTVTSATNFTSFHAKDIPAIVARTTDEAGNTTGLTGAVLTGKAASVHAKVSTATYESSRYGTGEFAITLDDTVEGYVWNDYFANLYAVTISDGNTTVGAMPWIDFYGESATSGAHYNKVEISVNNGTSIGSNKAEVHRYAAFYDENNNFKSGDYVVTMYSEGFDTVSATIHVKETYSGKVNAKLKENTLTIKNLPEDITAAKATVSYSYLPEGAKRPTTVNIAENVSIVDGKISIDADKLAEAGENELTLKVTSDNYLDISGTVEKVEAGVVYAVMNVPYTQFYAPYNLTDASYWEVESGIDAVSTATTSKFTGTTGLAKGTYNNGKYIMGVTLPVKLTEVEYDKLASKNLTENDNYYVKELENKPAAYSTLTVGEDGSYSFSEMTAADINKSYLSIDDLDINGNYGDYQISLAGFSTSKGIQIGAEEYISDYSILGAIIYTESGSYGMTCLENLWYGTRVPAVEIAWSIPEGKGLKRGHGSGGEFYQFDMNGDTISSVKVITTLGVIDVPANLKLTEYYAGDLSDLKYSIDNDSTELLISGIPSEFENVKITVSGGLAAGAVVTDGKVALTKAPTAGVSYTMTISSDNYPDISRTLSTPITDAQKAELKNLMEKAEATTGYADNADLKEHVAEAEELIEKAAATSVEAAELITELTEKIKKTYPTYTLNGTIKGNKVSLSLDGAELAELENPEYSITYSAGRGSAILTKGVLDNLEFELSADPTVGTIYTVTIVSDNYQDVVAEITADTGTVDPTPVHKHSYTSTVTPATTTADGKIVKTCACGATKTTIIPAAKTVKLAHVKYIYSGRMKKPAVVVKDKNGKVIDEANYTVKYAKGRKAVGTYTVKVTFKGNYKGSKTLKFKINPRKSEIKSIVGKKNAISVTWTKKKTQVTGYQVQYSTSAKFKNTKTVKVKSPEKATKTIKKLKGGKKYYVRVRTYKTVNGKTYYSAWSKKKAVTTKK